MNVPRHRPSEFAIVVRISQKRRLFVEDRDDKQAFRCLEDIARDHGLTIAGGLVLESAEDIDSPPGRALSNRQKVEEVCRELGGYPDLEDRYACFVDREFRPLPAVSPADQIVHGHYVSGRLIWSRGHSMENYFFAFGTMLLVLRSAWRTDSFDDAVDLFQMVMPSAIRLACTVGFVGRDLGNLNLLRGSIAWRLLGIIESTLTLDTSTWKSSLVDRLQCTEEMAQDLVDTFNRHNAAVTDHDDEEVRWMAHGHITLDVLRATYAQCVYQVSGNEVEANAIFRSQDRMGMNAFSNAWARRVLNENEVSPLFVLEMLGLST